MEDVSALRVSIGLNTVEFSAGIKDINRQLRAVKSEFTAAGDGTKKWQNSLDGLRAKSDSLTRQLEIHRQKVQMLKQQYLEVAAAQGENSRAAQNLLIQYNNSVGTMRRVETSLNGVNNQIRRQSSPWQQAARTVSQYSDNLKKIGGSLTSVGKQLSVGLTAPIAAAAGAAVKAAKDIGGAFKTIQKQTGATGTELEGLKNDFTNVFKNAPDSANEVSSALSLLHVRLGLVGDPLQTLTEQMLSLSRVTGNDVNSIINSTTRLFGDWSVSTNNQSKALDELFSVSQQTGTSIDKLSSTMVQYGAPLRQLGFSYEQAAAMVGKWNKEGVNTGLVMGGLRIALGNFAKAAKDPQKELPKLIEQIKNAGTTGQANALAIQIFGKRAGADMAAAIREGRFSIDDLVKSLGNSQGAIQQTGDSTLSMADKFQIIKNKVEIGLQPLGSMLLNLANQNIPKLTSAADKLTSAFANMSPQTRDLLVKVGAIAAVIGPVTVGLGSFITAIGTLGKVIVPVIAAIGGEGMTAALAGLAGPIAAAVVAIGLLVVGGITLKKAMDDAQKANLDYAKSLVDQKISMSNLSTQYDDLRAKNKLSNDEILRFRDIQSQLKTATSAAEIKKLKDEAAQLQQKSGLTNDEFSRMLTLNDQIIQKTPEVKQSFSARGNAIISNKGALDEINARLAENTRLELENQRIKAEANLTQNIQNYITALDELNAKEKARDVAIKQRDATDQRVTALKLQAQQLLNAGKDVEAQKIINQIADSEILLGNQNALVSKLSDEVIQKQNSVNKSQDEITKTQQLYDKMVNLQLAQVGINIQGNAGIAQLNLAIQKTQTRISQLNAAKQSQGGLNSAQQQELNNLQSALGKYQNTRGEIQKIQGEQQTVNKRINDGVGNAQNMNTQLGKGINKKVSIDDGGKADSLNGKVGQSITKKVTLQAFWQGLTSAARSILHFASGTNSAPGGWSLVGEEGPELMYVPRGAQIKTANDTRGMLNSKPSAAPSSAPNNNALIDAILGLASRPISLVVNGREFARATIDDITEIQNFNTNRKKAFNGG